MSLEQTRIDWDELSYLGVPIMPIKNSRKELKPTIQKLIKYLILATLEIQKDGKIGREMEAVQATLLAIKMDFPTIYNKYLRESDIIKAIMPKIYSGRIIKLKRIALANLSEYL